MKLTNFKISNDNIAIEDSDGRYFDLHNNFEFVNFNYLFEKRYFEINWKRSSGDWVFNTDPTAIKLFFTNVSILRVRELEQNNDTLEKYKSDDLSLSIISFTSKDDNEFQEYLANPNLEEINPIIIQSQNGQGFIILSEKAELEIED